MSANQTPTYTPRAITQRDGSKLQNSNCRMASIATGLDYDTKGAKKSTGAKMRSYTSDQEGGTDSGDAKQAWYNGYKEGLNVEDGKTWGDALTALKAGRVVHIDVWHKTVGGPCLSGTGAYGHTMCILPDCKDNAWLVADPWCSPGRWSRVSETKLKAGAEEWGRRVYANATSGPSSSQWRQALFNQDAENIQFLLARAAKRLMDAHYPGNEDPSSDPRIDTSGPDTGGAQRIMYTITAPQPLVTPQPPQPQPPAEGADMGIYFNPAQWKATKDVPVFLDSDCKEQVTTIKAGGVFYTLGVKAVKGDPDGKDQSVKAIWVTTGNLVPGGSESTRAILWTRASDYPPDSMPTEQAWDESVWKVGTTSTARYPCPPAPVPPSEDCTAKVTAAVRERDETWEEALMGGLPWPTVET